MTDPRRTEVSEDQAAGEASQPGDAERSDERLAAVEAERDEAIDQLKRVAADFDNYRKRAARERDELTDRANERLVKELLPVLDDLERALVAAAEHEEATLEEGVRLVHRSLAQLLERQGLKEIGAEGKFDPHVHEALLSQPSEQDEGDVIDVLQKGYKLGERVLRPARVIVASGPVHPPAAEPPVRGSGPGEGASGEPGGSPGTEDQ